MWARDKEIKKGWQHAQNTQTDLLHPKDQAVSYHNPPPPSPHHEIIFLFLWVKRKPSWKWKVTYGRAQDLGARERRWSLLQGPCCYSKHLPLCGRPFKPIVVQKLVVLPSGPEACRGPPCCSDMCLHRCVAPATITTDCGPLPPLPKYSMIGGFFSHPLCVVHFLRTLAG